MRTYQLNYNTPQDDPFGDGSMVTAKDVAQLADLIEQNVIKGDYCEISILDGHTSTGACQVYHRSNPEPFVECIEAWGSCEDITKELNACKA